MQQLLSKVLSFLWVRQDRTTDWHLSSEQQEENLLPKERLRLTIKSSCWMQQISLHNTSQATVSK